MRAPRDDPFVVDTKPLGVWTLLSMPVIRVVCGSSGALAYVAGSFNTVFVLQAYTPVEDGGLALSVRPAFPPLSPVLTMHDTDSRRRSAARWASWAPSRSS